MTAPRSASSGPEGTQADVQASQPETVIPRQRQAEAGRGTVEELAGRRMTSLGRTAWLAVLTAAVGCVAVGILLLAWPTATLTIVAILLGASLLVSGLLRLFDGFTARAESGGMRAAYIVVGLLAILVGLYCLRHRDVTIFLLALLVGAYWIVHGVADLAVAATSGPMPGRGLKVAAGLFSLAAGIVVLFWPAISLVLLLTILGAWLLFYGVLLAVLAFRLRRELKSVLARGVTPGPPDRGAVLASGASPQTPAIRSGRQAGPRI
jgi:uncharacterized membrane protein HdeD (DUF308 family)